MRSPETRPAFFRSRSHRLASLVVVVVFGLLLWAKLLLVTNHPRTAIADPKPAAPPTASVAADPGAE